MARTPQKKKTASLFKNKQWQQCLDDFLQDIYRRSYSTQSLQSYKSILTRFFNDPGRAPDTYTKQDVLRFLSAKTNGKSPKMQGQMPLPRTQMIRWSVLSSFYAFAQSYEVPYRSGTRALLHTTNPTARIRLSRGADPARDMTDEEISRFFAAIPRETLIGKRDRALFLAYFWTARRRGELVALRWEDLKPVTFMENGISRDGYMYTWRGKGHLSKDDYAEYPPPAFAALREYLVADGRWDNLQPSDALFPRSKGDMGQSIGGREAYKRFKIYAQQADLPDTICVHSLRHARAWVTYEENGHDIMEVSKLLRHKNLETTRIYLERQEKKHQPDTTAQRLAQKYGGL